MSDCCWQPRPRPSTSNPKVRAALIPFPLPLISFSDPEFIPLTAAAAPADADAATPGKQPETVPAASKGERRMGTAVAATKRLFVRERGGESRRVGGEGRGGGRGSGSQRGPRPLRRKPASAALRPPRPPLPTKLNAETAARRHSCRRVAAASEGNKTEDRTSKATGKFPIYRDNSNKKEPRERAGGTAE